MLLALFFFVIYGIIGMQMFGGALRRRCAYANPFEPTELEITDMYCAPANSLTGVMCKDILPAIAYESTDVDLCYGVLADQLAGITREQVSNDMAV
jgi:hypothetical protein